MTKFSIKKTKNKKGFSFIEGILAIFLVTAGMIAVLGLMSSSLQGSLDSRDQIIAAFLAQEGVEVVRNIRDNNWASGERDTFDHAVSNFPDAPDKGCRVIYSSLALDNCNDGNNNKALYYRSDNGLYSHNDNFSPTKFQRKIEVAYKESDGDSANRAGADMAEIISVVSWGSEGLPSGTIDDSSCNTANRCAFAKVVLSKWGE